MSRLSNPSRHYKQQSKWINIASVFSRLQKHFPDDSQVVRKLGLRFSNDFLQPHNKTKHDTSLQLQGLLVSVVLYVWITSDDTIQWSKINMANNYIRLFPFINTFLNMLNTFSWEKFQYLKCFLVQCHRDRSYVFLLYIICLLVFLSWL